MLLTPIITISVFIGSLWLLLKLYQYFFFSDAWKLRGPAAVPFLGNIFEFGSNIEECFNALLNLAKKHGQYVRIWLGPFKLQIILSDVDAIEHLLSSTVLLNKGEAYAFLEPYLGVGLLNSKPEDWRRQRKIIAPAFHFKILENFMETFNTSSDIFVNVLRKDGANGPIDVSPLAKLFGLDVTVETVMGLKLNIQLKENKDYVHAVDNFMTNLLGRYFSLLKRYQWYYQFTNDYQVEQKLTKTLRGMAKMVIKKGIQERNARGPTNNEAIEDEFGIKKKLAFLDLLLQLKGEKQMSEQELNNQVNTFLFAGHDTVSSVTSFALFIAAKHPEMQNRIVEEIHEVVGKDLSKPITMQHLQELKYVERFMKETMRMFTPVPFYERCLSHKFKIGKYMLPKGANVVIFAHGVHQDPSHYPDPEKFDPDRFLPEAVAARHPYAFIPYSAGIRNCIGQRFSMLLLKTVLVDVLRKLELSAVVPEHKLRLVNLSVMKSVTGLPIHIKVRQKC